MSYQLNQATIDATIECLKVDANNAKRWIKARDMLRGDGITSEMLTSNEDLRREFKAGVIVLSFTKAEQAIHAKPTTSLSDEEKVTKRWIQQQIGKRLSVVTQHIRKAEIEETLTDADREARRTATLETRLKTDLMKWIDKIEKAEAVTFSATKMLEHLKNANALLKG